MVSISKNIIGKVKWDIINLQGIQPWDMLIWPFLLYKDTRMETTDAKIEVNDNDTFESQALISATYKNSTMV